METAGKTHSAQFEREIGAYWDGRAGSYSNSVLGELGDERKILWKAALEKVSRDISANAAAMGGIPRACDLGCGPGFFTVLLCELGFAVDAVDASEVMVGKAQHNLAQVAPGAATTLHVCDLLSLPFPDDAFDLCVSRNVTWLMRDPERAYAEWLRVLRPGGKLVVYDANWYRYLVDPELAARRSADQELYVLEEQAEDARATADETRRCEELARDLPLTPIMRPAWDLETLTRLGAAWCHADEDVWRHVWTKSEQLYYGATPMFMVEAVK